MRNLKRVLSLALAMVMVLGVMIVSSSAASKDFVDADKIDYVEAVDVLTGLGILEGYSGSFNPDEILTREQAAKVLCYIMLGEENANKLGPNAQIFKDVAPTRWSAGYIAYCANLGLIAGYNGNFDPEGQLTGVAFAKLLLVAAGYNAEAEGYVNTSDWAMNIASDAIDAGIDVKGVILSNPLTREQMAQMVLQALEMDTVEYKKGTVIGLIGPYTVPATNTYNDYDTTTTATDGTVQFCEKYFSGLKKTAGADDAWGRPALRAWTYTDKGTTKTLHTVMATPVASYTTAKTECDIASDLGLKTTATGITVYTNGYVTDRVETINPLATIAKMGAQGRLTEVYKVGVAYRIVYIDTYLAKVTNVVNATFDAAGHLRTSSSLVLDVYTAGVAERVTLYGGDKNYTYTRGQMLLVNAVDNAYGNIATKAGTYGTTPSTLDILKAPDSIIGAQSTIWWNVEQHTVNGTIYNDAHTFYLDEAGTETANHTWYFDLYGNLIGVTDIATQYTYGVISALWWVNDSSTGTGHATATLTYMDGTTANVTLGLIDDDGVNTGSLGYVPVGGYDNVAMTARAAQSATQTGEVTVSTNAYINITSGANGIHGYIGGHMFQFETLADGTVAAYKVVNEVTSATINRGTSAVTGTNGPAYINSDTVFLVRTGTATTGYTYTSVTDYNNIGNYTGATVDYVNTDTDIYAEYVYLYGTSIDNSSAFVFANGNNYSAPLRTNGGIQYYEFTYGVNMDGTTSTLKVPVDGYTYNGTTYNPVTNVLNRLLAGYGKLFKIEYVNGYAVNAIDITAGSQTSGSYTAAYLGYNVVLNGNSLAVNGTPAYNTTNSVVVIGGTVADLAVPNNGLNVYVVYSTTNNNYVQYIYITRLARNTVADATAVLRAGDDYGTIAVVDGTSASAEAAVLTAVNARLAAAGITGVTATINPSWHIIVTAVTQYFQIELADAFGGTASVIGNTVVISNSTSTATLNAAIKARLESNQTVTSTMTKAQVENRIAAIVAAAVTDTSNLTITVVLPASMTAGQIVNVVVTGTVDGVAVNTSAQVVVQA